MEQRFIDNFADSTSQYRSQASLRQWEAVLDSECVMCMPLYWKRLRMSVILIFSRFQDFHLGRAETFFWGDAGA